MVNKERPKTKAREGKERREDSVLRFDTLRFIPNGFKLPFVLHAISQLNNSKVAFKRNARKGFVMSNDLVYRVPKNEKEEFGFSVREYKDRLYCDIRIYFKGSDGNWHPTRKGVSFSAGFMPEMEKGFSELVKLLSTSGVRS